MKIIFTPDIFYMQQFGGISRYYVRLAEELQLAQNKAKIVAPFHINQHLSQSHINPSKNRFSKKTRLSSLVRRAANSIALQSRIAVDRPDIVHSTFFRRFPPLVTRAKRILTVFDLIDEFFHQSYSSGSELAARKRRSIEEADLILCISENTRQDLIQHLNVDPAKTRITYLAADTAPNVSENERHPLEGQPYILYVGSRFGYKNFDTLLAAFAQKKQINKYFKLVAFGSAAFDANEISLFEKYNLTRADILHRTGHDAELYRYYRHADLFIYPSKYEGFGIPPLEAMSVGCPVACSNTSSIPEVVGDAAFLFDPNSIESIAETLDLAIKNSDLRAEKIALGYQQNSKFSWAKCARDTLDSYRSISGPF